MCREAKKCLCDLADKLKEGKVTVQELKMLTTHLTQAVKLYSPNIVETVANDPTFNITNILVQRNSEVTKFESYCAAIRNLLKYCKNITDGKFLCIAMYYRAGTAFEQVVMHFYGLSYSHITIIL